MFGRKWLACFWTWGGVLWVGMVGVEDGGSCSIEDSNPAPATKRKIKRHNEKAVLSSQ